MAELDSYGEFSLTSVSDTKALLSPIESAPRIKVREGGGVLCWV